MATMAARVMRAAPHASNVSRRALSSRDAPTASRRAPPTASRRSAVIMSAAASSKQKCTIKDIMCTPNEIITCKQDDSVDHALELIVDHRITSLPVLDSDGVLVGVVSDFDLLAQDAFGAASGGDLFPEPGQTWEAFSEVRRVLARGTGKFVSDVMTTKPLTVKLDSDLDEATGVLFRKKIRRMPVVDDSGRLLGLLSRRAIVRAALMARKESKA